MHTESWVMPGGWVASRGVSDERAADVQEAIVGALVGAGWTVTETYRASYKFGQLFQTVTAPTTAIAVADKLPKACGFTTHDYTTIIDGKTYVGFDPFRELPPPSPCKGFPLGESVLISAQNFASVASGSPYTIKIDGAGPSGIGIGFTAVAKAPGARGDAYQLAFPIGYYDDRLGLEAYPGYLLESPEDHNGLKYKIHVFDGATRAGESLTNACNHCFIVYDSYGGNSDPFMLHGIVRDRSLPDVPLLSRFNGWIYRYEIIATEDSLLVIPYEKMELDLVTQEITSIHETYSDSPPYTSGCLYVARPVVTQEAIDSGVEASLFCHMPSPGYGYDEMNSLWSWALLQGLNEPLEPNNGRSNWSSTSITFPTFRSAVNEIKIRDARGNVITSSVFALAAQSDAEEAGLVGKLNSVVAVADPTYTGISRARMQTADGHWWKLIFQNQPGNRWGFFYNFSLWMAESDTPKGQFYDPGETTTETPRAMSSVLNPSNNWVLQPLAESGNDAILFSGGEGILTISLLHDDPGWPITSGSYPAGDPGSIYWDAIPAVPDLLGKFVRVWGFPDCDRVGHSYTYTFRATDGAAHHIDQVLTVTVTEGSFVSMLPVISDLTAYKCVTTNFDFSTGCPGGTIALTAWHWEEKGTIPPGMSFLPLPGTATIVASVTGTPTAAGYFEFTITASDPSSGNVVAWRMYKLTVIDVPGVSC